MGGFIAVLYITDFQSLKFYRAKASPHPDGSAELTSKPSPSRGREGVIPLGCGSAALCMEGSMLKNKDSIRSWK
jgi:hypothetical protein